MQHSIWREKLNSFAMSPIVGDTMNELLRLLCMELDGIAPYDFEKTIHKYTLYGIEWYWLTPFEVFLKGTIWTAMRLNNTPIGLRLRSIGNIENPKVSVSIFSKDKLSNGEENEVVNTLTWMLGLKEDILDFYKLADNYKPLKQAKEDLFGMRIAKNPNFLIELY
jgi:hypothetical protein